jgi:hypothetical protein
MISITLSTMTSCLHSQELETCPIEKDVAADSYSDNRSILQQTARDMILAFHTLLPHKLHKISNNYYTTHCSSVMSTGRVMQRKCETDSNSI